MAEDRRMLEMAQWRRHLFAPAPCVAVELGRPFYSRNTRSRSAGR